MSRVVRGYTGKKVCGGVGGVVRMIVWGGRMRRVRWGGGVNYINH